MSSSERLLRIAFIAVLSGAASGCTTVSPLLPASGLLGAGSGGEPPPTAPPSVTHQGPAVAVRIQPGSGTATELRLPLSKPAFVQSLVKQSGASERFRRMNIELYRPLATGHHRMEIPYDRVAHQVPPGSDYALHDGDLLVITEDTSTALDDLLESLRFPNPGSGRR